MKATWLPVLLAAAILMVPSIAWGHTGLEKADPENNAIVKEEQKEINLQFNTTLEKASTLSVQSSEGKTVELKEVETSGKTLTGVLAEPLPDGQYTVKWKIVGVDGHPIDGEYTFTVQLPEKSTEKEQPDTEIPAPAPENEPTESAEPAQTPWYQSSMTWVVSGLVIAALASLWISLRRKR